MNSILKNIICCLLIIILLNLVLKTYERFSNSNINIKRVVEVGEQGNSGAIGDCYCNNLTSEIIMKNISKVDFEEIINQIQLILEDKDHFLYIYRKFIENESES